MILNYVIITLISACVGSFLNMLIYRLPLHLNWVKGRSKCTHCNHTLGIFNLIPVLSYLFLLGKCHYCRHKISARYVLNELGCIAIGCLGFYLYSFTWPFIFFCILWWILLSLIWIDLEHMILPNSLTYFLMILGLIQALINQTLPSNVLAGTLAGVLFLCLSIIAKWVYKKEAVGMGDIKCAVALGLNLGLKTSLIGFYIAFVLGGVIGLSLIVLKRKTRQDYIPFGPFLIAGAFISFFWGSQLWNLILR